MEADVIKRTIVTSAYQQAESLAMNGAVSFGGWGAKAKASFAKKDSSSLSVSEVKFVASRRMKYGYRGWSLAPAFSDVAK